jgi:hypothetical protein
MMAAVTEALSECGAIGVGEIPRYHIGLTYGDTVWLDAFRRDGSFVHAKVAEHVTLREEVRVYHEALHAYDDFMPAPIGYSVRGPWEIFLAEGIEHRPLSVNPLNRSRGAHQLREELSRFFARGAQKTSPNSPVHDHDALLKSLDATFRDTPFVPLVKYWRSSEARQLLDAIGAAPQHGDFVTNNIGTRKSRLVVYDWEDFGKVSLPGFDLCTFAISLMNEGMADEDGLMHDGTGGDCLGSLVNPACAALNLDADHFWRLVPLYLLTFLHLKQGYGSRIRSRIERLLTRHSSEAAATVQDLVAV